jgi:hypothetical protein
MKLQAYLKWYDVTGSQEVTVCIELSKKTQAGNVMDIITIN